MCMTYDGEFIEMLNHFIGEKVVVNLDPGYGNPDTPLKGIFKGYCCLSPGKVDAIEILDHSGKIRIVRTSAIYTIGKL